MKTCPAVAAAFLLLACSLPATAATGKDEVAALLKQLKGDPAMSNRAAALLAKLGPDDKDVVPVLIDGLKKEPEPFTTPVIVTALAHIGPAAVPELTEALKDNRAEVRTAAAQALRDIGPGAKEAVPALVALIQKDRAPVNARVPAIEALATMGPAAKEAVPALTAVLKEKQPDNPARLPAIMALGRIGPAAKEAVPQLAQVVKEPENVSGPAPFHAATALGQIGPDAKEAVPALVEMVKNAKLGPARVVAVEALGEIGPDAKEAVSALNGVMNDTGLRKAATRALEKIQKK